MNSLLLIRYGEIALKGKNRPFFEKNLLRNIQNSLEGLNPLQVHFRRGRYYVEIAEENVPGALRRLQKVFGIVSISPVSRTELDLEAICREAFKLLQEEYRYGLTFKVNARRANKRFPLTTPEINSKAGAFLLQNLPGLKVDVHNPEVMVNIEIREKEAYLYTRSIPGPGGLPVGVTGRGLLLLSGGIDSPVAGWIGLKRGVELESLHFHSPPFTGEGVINKVEDICKVLAAYSGSITLHLAPFTEIQKEIRRNCPEKMMITLMRRAMFRIAERLAARRGIGVLFTGESLGQVASQTMENLIAIDQAIKMPVFRPLIGMDKEEISALARKIDTYSISIRPHDDCCTLFIPRHPVTRPLLEDLEKAEGKLPLDELIENCLEKIESKIILPEA